jgi:hypothetical protein
LVGPLVGAGALGLASPHLFLFAGGVDWRFTLMIASTSAVLAGVLILVTSEGSVAGRATGFKLGDVNASWTNRGIRFANLGYLGHMWELFAMYAWIGPWWLVVVALVWGLTIISNSTPFSASVTELAEPGSAPC